MNVYMIRGDSDYFGASVKHDHQKDLVRESDRENRPIPAGTEIVGWYYPDEGKEEPVFTDIGYLGYETTLLLHRPRTDALRPMLEKVGTILPMTSWRGESFEAFVCDTQLDAIDRDRLEYYPDDHPIFYGMVRRHAFKAAALDGATVFRLKGRFGRLFATDRFLDLVKAEGLTGLRVLPLWSSETGPIGFVEDPMVEFERYPPGVGRTPAEKRATMRRILEERDRRP